MLYEEVVACVENDPDEVKLAGTLDERSAEGVAVLDARLQEEGDVFGVAEVPPLEVEECVRRGEEEGDVLLRGERERDAVAVSVLLWDVEEDSVEDNDGFSE